MSPSASRIILHRTDVYKRQGEKCVGLAIYKRDWFKFLYLEDLKVSGEYRGHGVGRRLITEGQKIAHEMGLIGQYTICLLYTSQQKDSDIEAASAHLKNVARSDIRRSRL